MSARHFHFSLIGNNAQDRPKADGNTMRIGRVTWLGLTMAVIGWAMLLGEVAMADFVNVQDPLVLPPTFHDDFMEIGKTLIFSGFGLALIGALQTGFGALNRFFEAVLVRSGQKTQASALSSPAESFRRENVVEATPRAVGRPYKTFADGSVEVETIVGSRRFRSMMEARDFI